MPKIEVNEKLFFSLLGKQYDRDGLEKILPTAKAELDEWDQSDPDAEGRTIKIELNDTNRPDLWSTAGLARQLRTHRTGRKSQYEFFAHKGGAASPAPYAVEVEKSVEAVRPYLAGFVAKGVSITDPMLRDMIQTQEKLAWNFGRKRRTISIGLYRPSIINWPVHYRGVDPDSVSFVPLQETRKMTLRQILSDHPKGREYAFILEKEPIHPLLTDVNGRVLSYPPIINSADLGAVVVGDSDLFIEVTGGDYPSVALAASIMACDLSDLGFTIENVEVRYPYDTPFGRKVVFPLYFQDSVALQPSLASKLLGKKIDADGAVSALKRMGLDVEKRSSEIVVAPPEYRNDFLHPVDVVEDILIGEGMDQFPPERPRDFTIGRLSPIEYFSRRMKSILVGLGYQEMIYNYLGSRRDFVDRMGLEKSQVVKISNPMSESFEYVRNSPLPGLLGTEMVSVKAPYPHRTFEVGKVAIPIAAENYGVSTRQYLGLLASHSAADYNEIAAHISSILYYVGKDYSVKESQDPRFIVGRQAALYIGETRVGVFGEVHPAVLEAFDIAVPTVAGELDLDLLL